MCVCVCVLEGVHIAGSVCGMERVYVREAVCVCVLYMCKTHIKCR